MCPIRPDGDGPIESPEILYANPMLAMRIASAVIDHPFERRAFDSRRRFCRDLQRLSLPSLQPLIDEANANDGKLASEWEIELTPDEMKTLDRLVCMMEVLSELKIYAGPK
jgi:hypothetical protein